jgi:hypothetical protein
MIVSANVPTFHAAEDQESPYLDWILENFSPYIHQRILVFTNYDSHLPELFAARDLAFHLTTESYIMLPGLRTRYQGNKLIRSIGTIDFRAKHFAEENASMQEMFSTVLVLQTFANESEFKSLINNITSLLRPNGRLLFSMRSFTALFADFNCTPEEIKFWDRKPMEQMATGFEVEKTRHFYLETSSVENSTFCSQLCVAASIRKRDQTDQT